MWEWQTQTQWIQYPLFKLLFNYLLPVRRFKNCLSPRLFQDPNPPSLLILGKIPNIVTSLLPRLIPSLMPSQNPSVVSSLMPSQKPNVVHNIFWSNTSMIILENNISIILLVYWIHFYYLVITKQSVYWIILLFFLLLIFLIIFPIVSVALNPCHWMLSRPNNMHVLSWHTSLASWRWWSWLLR